MVNSFSYCVGGQNKSGTKLHSIFANTLGQTAFFASERWCICLIFNL